MAKKNSNTGGKISTTSNKKAWAQANYKKNKGKGDCVCNFRIKRLISLKKKNRHINRKHPRMVAEREKNQELKKKIENKKLTQTENTKNQTKSTTSSITEKNFRGRGEIIKINNTEVYVQKKNENNKGKGDFVCDICEKRFISAKQRRRHARKNCGISFTKYQENREKENQKVRKMKEKKAAKAREEEADPQIKKILEKNGIECNDKYICVVDKYKFKLPHIKNQNNLLYYGSYNNQYTILKIFKYCSESERKTYAKINELSLNEENSFFPTVLFFGENVLVETYEGPDLKSLFNFCAKIKESRCDMITLCNIALDVLNAYKKLTQVGLFYFDMKPQNLTWNFKKNKIILIDFDNVSNEEMCNSYFKGTEANTKELRSLESLLCFLMFIYKKPLWAKSVSEHRTNEKDIYFKNKVYKKDYEELPNLCYFLEQVCSINEFDSEFLNRIIAFFSNKLSSYKNVGYRFIWEKYFNTIHEKISNGKIERNFLQKVFHEPFCLEKYFSYKKRKENKTKIYTKKPDSLISIENTLKDSDQIEIDKFDLNFIFATRDLIKAKTYINAEEILRKKMIKKCYVCNESELMKDFVFCKVCSDCFHKKCVENNFDVCGRCQNREGINLNKIFKEYKIYSLIFTNINTSNKFQGTLKLPKKFVKVDLDQILKEKKIEFCDNLVYSKSCPEILNKYFLEDIQILSEDNIQTYNEFKKHSINGMYCPVKIEKSERQNYIVKSTDSINKNTIICEYAGDVLFFRDVLFRESNDSKMDLINGPNSDLSLVIYPYLHANLGRFLSGINNATKDKCNVLSAKVRINDSIHVLLIAKCGIKKNEILYYDYNGGILNEYNTSNFIKE